MLGAYVSIDDSYRESLFFVRKIGNQSKKILLTKYNEELFFRLVCVRFIIVIIIQFGWNW